jgi:tRNA pseudouridine13 synthase
MNDEPPESPSKRRKLASSLVKSEGNGASHPTSDLQSQVGYMSPQSRMASAQNRQSDLLGSRGTREDEVGITQYVNAASIGFTGILKKRQVAIVLLRNSETDFDHRYTDFMVNEILPSGQVVHLNDVRIPKTAKSEPKAQAESPSTASIEVSRENGNASPTSKQGADHVPLPGLGDSVSAKPTATREEEQNPGQVEDI